VAAQRLPAGDPLYVPGACHGRSSLGYQCSWTSPEGVRIHWSNGTDVPLNDCTTRVRGALAADFTRQVLRRFIDHREAGELDLERESGRWREADEWVRGQGTGS